jgi:hypothetical protein
MRIDLGFDDAPEIERLLIDRIVLTWLHLQHVEYRRSAQWSTGDSSHARLSFYDRATERAQADHVRAITALARLRKLRLPNVAQVNIVAPGAQQTNLAQVAPG